MRTSSNAVESYPDLSLLNKKLESGLMRFRIRCELDNDRLCVSDYGFPFWIEILPDRNAVRFSTYIAATPSSACALRLANANPWGIRFSLADDFIDAKLLLRLDNETGVEAVAEFASEFGWQCQLEFNRLRRAAR